MRPQSKANRSSHSIRLPTFILRSGRTRTQRAALGGSFLRTLLSISLVIAPATRKLLGYLREHTRPEDIGGHCSLGWTLVCPRCVNKGSCDPFEEKLKRAERSDKWATFGPLLALDHICECRCAFRILIISSAVRFLECSLARIGSNSRHIRK